MIYFFLKLVLQFVQFLELKFWTSRARREVGRPREASKHLNLELCYPKQCSHSIFSQKFLFKSNLRFPLRGSNDLFPKCNIRSFNSRIKRYMYIHRSCKNKCMLFLGNCQIIFRKVVKSKKQKKQFFWLYRFPKHYFRIF